MAENTIDNNAYCIGLVFAYNLRMRRFALISLLLLGCSSKIGNNQKGTVDAREIDYQVPPEPKEGSGTAPGCMGITARGECQQNIAVFCDIDRNMVRRVDCGAQMTTCIRDVARGAQCKSVDTDPNGGTTSPCTDTQVSEAGYCTSDNVAVFCDTSGPDPQTKTWNCAAEGKNCNNCPNGERCCGGTPPPPGMECGDVDFDGVCEGNTVKWCNDDILNSLDCDLTGQACNDTCEQGFYCCGETTDECATVGMGVCSEDKRSFDFCFGDTVETWDCDEDEECKVGFCGSGADCCDIGSLPMNRCTDIGVDGVCTPEGKLEYCLGTLESEIESFDCAAGETCQIDVEGCYQGGAACCPEPTPPQ